MRIWLKNPALVSDLREYLSRCNCEVRPHGRSALYVELSGPVKSPEWARMQLQAYVSVWQALHPRSEPQLFA
jgi:hypothetical protein